MRISTEFSRIDASPSSFIRRRPVHAKRPLRRLALELELVVLAKLAFLMLIWWLLFAPHPKPDASAAAIARQFAPAAQAPPKAQP